MSYTIKLVLGEPPGPESDDGLPTLLRGPYEDREEAARDALTYIEMRRSKGQDAYFHILDENGNDVTE